jgi:hypothetical protein
MKMRSLSILMLTAVTGAAAAQPVVTPSGEDASRAQRRSELRHAIASQRDAAGAPGPSRTLSERERAELREQLRRESPSRPAGAAGLAGPEGGRPARP